MNGKNKRDLLIKISKETIAETSFNEMNINDLTKKCNLSKSTFYHYFNSKDEIYTHILNNIIENDYQNLNKLNIKDDLEENISLIIEFFLKKDINDVIIMKKEFLNGFNFISDENIKTLKKIDNFFKTKLKLININYDFLIISLINITESFLILKKNNLSEKNVFKNNEINKKMETLENYNFIYENIKIMILSYIKNIEKV